MITRRLVVASAAAALAAPALAQGSREMPKPGKRAWAAQVPVIRIGLLGGENDADRLARYGAYGKLIEQTFEVPVKLLPAADYAGVIQAFAAKQIELSYMSPAAYAQAWLQSDGNIIPLTTSQEKDGTTYYVSVLYVRSDSGITSLEQLKGKALAWADPNSASGYLIPRSEFRTMGIDPEPGKYFGRIGFAGGHEQAVVAVLNRQYDAGVTWASGIGDVNEGYTRGNLRIMVEKKMLDMKDLRIIWKSRPIENGPLAVRGDTPAEFQTDMLALHLAIPKAYPDIYHAVDMGSSQDWVPVKHADYQVFVDMLKAEAAQRRSR
jgi:phosphonate transport system substrate-binding protein